jgi:hypothetical protein
MSLRKSVVTPLMVGLFGFANVSRIPRFASFHTVDILQLLVSGMCFGIALAAVVARYRANALNAGAGVAGQDQIARG